MKQSIEEPIRTTLVIQNKQSIHLAVDKIMAIVDDNLNHCLNDAFCSPKRIKPLPTNSNAIADFINKWLESQK